MEHLSSHLDNSIPHSSLRECRSHVSPACLDRGGLLEAGRRRNARYCADCARIVRRQQSRLGKRMLRQNPVYRKHQSEYRRKRREKHADYMRGWRARHKQMFEMTAAPNLKAA